MQARHRLRYRFIDLEQARAHVHDAGGRPVFFVPDEACSSDAPVGISFTFDADVPRLLHGRVRAAVQGTGTWLELLDTRPLRDLGATGPRGRSVRSVPRRRSKRAPSSGSPPGTLLDCQHRGGRASRSSFAPGIPKSNPAALPDRFTFHDLSTRR